MSEFNIYCDESCHLENSDSDVMTLGGIYCTRDKSRHVTNDIISIKSKYNISPKNELKWTKISPTQEALYLELLNYFFREDSLHFRCVIIDKTKLNHEKFQQVHDEWYYKMYYTMLKIIFNPSNSYNVYLDIKDTNSHTKAQKLHKVHMNAIYDFNKEIVKKIQPIRSHEVQIMQLVDILTGAIAYANRKFPPDFKKSSAKTNIVELIKQKSGYALNRTTLYREEKFNLFVWDGKK